MKFAVIGLGSFGSNVAKTLYEKGNEVLAVDKDKQKIEEVKAFVSHAVHMDADDKENLLALGIQDMDVVIVLGANDVVNPVAREENNPISGMPILNVDQAGTVIVIKRSLSPGFAGISNPLFAADNTLMFFGDGRAKMEELVKA